MSPTLKWNNFRNDRLLYVPFFQRVTLLVREALHKPRSDEVYTVKAVRNLKGYCRHLKEIQTAVVIYGVGTKTGTLARKILCFTAAISGQDSTFLVWLHRTYPLLGCVPLVMVTNAMCFYSIMWSSADKVRSLTKKLHMGRYLKP